MTIFGKRYFRQFSKKYSKVPKNQSLTSNCLNLAYILKNITKILMLKVEANVLNQQLYNKILT